MARLLQPDRHLGGRLGWAGLAALALALAGCGRPTALPVGADGLPRVRFQTDWYPQAEHGGFYQAVAKGYYRDAGLNVEILPGRPGLTPVQAVLSGLADLAMSRGDDVISMISRDLPLVVVGAYMEHDPQGILVHAEDTVRTFRDLNGRTLMAGPGMNWTDFIQRKYGIHFRTIPVNYGIAQFMADPKFTQQCFVTSEPYYVRLHGGNPRVIPISDSGYDPYRVIFTTDRFLQTHRREVAAFMSASLRGWADFMGGDPSPGAALIIKGNAQMTPELVRFSIQAMKDYRIVEGDPKKGEYLGLMTRRRMQDQIDILGSMGLLGEPIKVDDFVTFDFVPKK